MKKHTKKSSFKKGKSTHRGSSAVATQGKKKRQKGMDPENVTSQENLYTHEESEESNESYYSSDSYSEEEQLDREDDTQCKNDVVNTEPTTSMYLLENSEARQKELEEEIRFFKKKNASMEKVINSNTGFFGKNKRRSKYDLTPQDQLIQRTTVVFMKSVMFPLVQILPE